MYKRQTSHPSFDWNYLGFGLARLWLVQWMAFPFVASGAFAISADLIFFLPAAAAGLFAAFGARHLSGTRLRTTLFIVSAAFSLVGTTLLCLLAARPSNGMLALGLACAGIGAGLLQTLWGDKFASLPTSQSDLYTVGSMLLASLLQLLTRTVNSLEMALFLFALVPAASFVLLFRGFRAGEWEGEDKANGTAEEPLPSIGLGRLCVSIVVFVFAYNFAARVLFPTAAFGSSAYSIRHVANICVMLLLLLVLWRSGTFKSMVLYRLSFPILIVALLVVLWEPQPSSLIASTAAAAGYKLFDVLFWCVLVGMAHRNRQRTWQILGLGMGANMVGMGFGMGAPWLYDVAPFLQTMSTPSVAGTLIVALAIIALLILPESTLSSLMPHGDHRHGRGAAASANDESATAATLASRCDAAAAAHSLTTREREVLLLLAQGRTQSVIAERLGISTGTAHTHIAHVYQKMGVHSQQELIDAIEGIFRVTLL